jgi:hypothetical protein
MGSILRQALITVSATGRKNVRLKNKIRHFSDSHFSVRIVIVILLCCSTRSRLQPGARFSNGSAAPKGRRQGRSELKRPSNWPLKIFAPTNGGNSEASVRK